MVKEERDIQEIDEFTIKEVKNIIKKKPFKIINVNLPLSFWKAKRIFFQIDSTLYTNATLYQIGTEPIIPVQDIKALTNRLTREYQFQKCTDFQSENMWYMLKYFFIISKFHYSNPLKLVGLLGGVPSTLKIKCKCGKNLLEQFWLRGIFDPNFSLDISQFKSLKPEHDFYFRISKECTKCHSIICIYRPKIGVIFPLMAFLPFIVKQPSITDYTFSDFDMILSWCYILEKSIFDHPEILKIYKEDFLKFSLLIKNNKKLTDVQKKLINSYFSFSNLTQ